MILINLGYWVSGFSNLTPNTQNLTTNLLDDLVLNQEVVYLFNALIFSLNFTESYSELKAGLLNIIPSS